MPSIRSLTFDSTKFPTAVCESLSVIPPPATTYVEVETLLLLAILFAAISLSTQPPAIALTEQQATWTELYEVFRPKVPRLSSPSYAEAVGAFSHRSSADAGITAGVRTYWSDYNHNVSGLFVVSMALLALAPQAGITWDWHWPLGFIALSIFILLRSDAEDSWPFGHLGFLEGMLSNDAILLHHLGALIPCVLGCIEWQVRVNSKPSLHLPYVIPMLCAAGGPAQPFTCRLPAEGGVLDPGHP